MKYLLNKLTLVGASPPRAGLKHIFWSWVGSAIAIGAVAWVAYQSQFPILFAPLGASAVLAFAVFEAPLAQPRNIIGGHVISAATGMAFLVMFGNVWWAIPFAVATAIAAMMLSKTVHPPAGANPILVIMAGAKWGFILETVIPGAVILTLCALIFNNVAGGRKYPTYWW